jgi:hypothetical protein
MKKYIIKGSKIRKNICIIVSIVGIIIITTVITKIYSAHHKWVEINEALVKNTRDAYESMTKSYQDVSDVIQKGIDETNKQSLGQAFDETSITRAIIAIQGLANGDEVLNSLVQTRIGYYSSESEKLIALKKLLDDYILALEYAKNNPKEIAMSYDTGSFFDEGYETDMNDLGTTAQKLIDEFNKFKEVAGITLDSYKEEFIALKEEGLGYAETLEFINKLIIQTNNIEADKNNSQSIKDAVHDVKNDAMTLKKDLIEGQAEYQKHWKYVKDHTTTFNQQIIKYDKDYFGLSKDNFDAFAIQQSVVLDKWLAATSVVKDL